MRIRTLWVGFSNEKVSLQRLNQGRLCFLMECVAHYESWKILYMWVLKIVKEKQIISIALPKVY
jgi:hypothetical protein